MVFREWHVSRYLDLVRKVTREAANCEKSEIREGRSHISQFASSQQRFSRVLAALESRCPEHVSADHWQQAVEDGRRFLAQWGEQAEALGWTPRDLFGLAPAPNNPRPGYRRLSRYDETGLIWLLRGRQLLALTQGTAAIESPTGAVTVYRRHNKPALGPLGDSLEDFA
jgi:hypothetical protein